MSEVVKVDIWSDIACPFCYIGKKQFESGVADSGVPVQVEYHSYELAPETPDQVSASHAEHLMHRMGVSLERAQGMEAQTIAAARGVGLEIDYDILQQSNTRRAHQLLHHAKAQGKQVALTERLMIGYFAEGRSMADVDDLADLAAEVGLDRDEALGVLERDEFRQDVEDDKRVAAAYGISGVPFFVIDGKYGVSGAQAPAAFAQALTQARNEKEGSQRD